MRVRTRVRRFSVHVRKCTYVQNVLPRETQDVPPSMGLLELLEKLRWNGVDRLQSTVSLPY